MPEYGVDDDDVYEPEYEPEMVQVGETIQLEVLAVVPPPLEYMASLHSEQQEISGRQVWTGSLLLAHALEELIEQDGSRSLFHHKSVLELGSGTGLLGMAISKMCNPTAIVLTDGDKKAVDLLIQNLENTKNVMNTSIVKAAYLLWGDVCDGSNTNEFSDFCRTAYDGSVWASNAAVRFDNIVAGDVMYKANLPSLFFKTVSTLLNDEGCLWLCHVPRNGITQEYMIDAAELAGLTVTVLQHPQTQIGGCPTEDRKRAVLYRMTRRDEQK